MSNPNGMIRVEGDTLIISGVHFAVTPSEIDAGPLNLAFVNCMSDRHETLRVKAGGSSAIQSNVFGCRPSASPKLKPWWRFW